MKTKVTYHIESEYMGSWGVDDYSPSPPYNDEDAAIAGRNRLKDAYPHTDYRVVKNTTTSEVVA